MKNLLAIALLSGAALAACSTTTPPEAPVPKIATAAPAPNVPSAEPVKPNDAPPKTAESVPGKPPAETASKPAPKPAPAAAAAGKSAAPKAPAKPGTSAPPRTETAAPAKAEAVAKAPAAAPAAAKAAPLDLRSLEQRLKDSNAIGVMTKLSLKNQVDDLVGRFRAYHSGERPPTLPQLRPAFELLLMKVLSLLQDKDPALAHDIDASREAIWGVLSDRARFAQFT